MPRVQKEGGYLRRLAAFFKGNKTYESRFSVYVHQMGEEGNTIQADKQHGFYNFHNCTETYAAEAAADAYRIEHEIGDDVRLSVLVLGGKRSL